VGVTEKVLARPKLSKAGGAASEQLAETAEAVGGESAAPPFQF